MNGASKYLATVLAAALAACAGARREGAPPVPVPAAAAEAGDADALMRQGERELSEGRAATAAQRFEQAAALRPRDDRPLLAETRARIAAADVPRALAAADRALSLRDSPEGRALRGRVLSRQRQWDAARADLDRAVEGDPRDAASWALLAAVQANRGDRLEAAHAYRQAAALLPPLDAAKAVWRELRFLPPDPVQPEESLDRCTRAYTALLEGQPAEALREATSGMRFAPQFEWCGVVRAEALWRTNDPSGAEQILRWAVKRYTSDHEPLRADAKGVLAELLSLRKETAPEAAELARAALAVRGDRAAVLVALARACEATGDAPCVKNASTRLAGLPHLPAALRAEAEERVK